MNAASDEHVEHHDRVRALRWLAAIAAGALLFALGVSVGEALRDNPKPGLTTTSVTTIAP